jgi:S1-C subfamily serine protease/tetratricopeptide (TPR) repeat protein
MCGYECSVPNPKSPKRRTFLILGAAGGVLTGAVLAVVITIALTSHTGPSPSPSNDSPGPKATAQPVAQSPSAQQEPSREKPTPPGSAQSQAPKRPEPAPLSPEQLFEKASPAVVYIVVRDKEFKPIGLGSGFFVDANGLVATNYHVIKGAEFATARLSNGSTLFVDGVVATDPNGDLALLKVSGGGFPCLKRGEGALPKVGAAVFAIGNPQGLENTFSSGMVSGHREINEGLRVIQVTTPISPGSSGGPLLNASGEVVGVTTAYLATGQNLNFAVPVSGVLALIRKQGKVQTLASAGGDQFDSAETDELDKAWAAMGKKDWGTAAKILAALRKKQKDNPVVWFALGRLHGLLGNQDIAIEHYKQAIALKPDYVQAYLFMGFAYEDLKRYTEAIAAYKQIIVLKPDDAEAYGYMGNTFIKLKCYSEAIAACKQAIALKPSAADYELLGIAYHELKQYTEAVAAYKQAIALDPSFSGFYSRMGDAYQDMKRYPEAITAYKQAIAVDPNDAGTYINMGEAYCEVKRYPEAIEAYEQYLRLEPAGSKADDVRKVLPELRRLARRNEIARQAALVEISKQVQHAQETLRTAAKESDYNNAEQAARSALDVLQANKSFFGAMEYRNEDARIRDLLAQIESQREAFKRAKAHKVARAVEDDKAKRMLEEQQAKIRKITTLTEQAKALRSQQKYDQAIEA